jgi:hypothetical protein
LEFDNTGNWSHYINDTVLDLYIQPDENRYASQHFHDDLDDEELKKSFNTSTLNFTWTLMSISGKRMSFELEFDEPFEISPQGFKDKLYLHVKNHEYYSS